MDLTYILIPLAAVLGVIIARAWDKKSKPVTEEKSVEKEPVQEKQIIADLDPQTKAKIQAMVVEQAKSKAREIIVEAKDEALKIKTKTEDEVRKVRAKADELERKFAIQKAQLETKEQELEKKSKSIEQSKDAVSRRKAEIDAMYNKQKESLERVASMNKEEARNLLMQNLEKDLASEKGKRIREVEEEIKRDSEKLMRDILVPAMRHGATDYVVEYSTSKVKLEDEGMKGRIIGKEGRNIRVFEELTGVDLDMDSSPGEVIVSSFDPVRREIAKVSLERLIADGRIQPAKIEEVIQKTTTEVESMMQKAGDDLCHKVGAYNIPQELVKMLGRFKYRFSYGQNMIEHTLEETKIGMALARELKADVEIVKLGCLFHDIGKVVDEDEGTHVELGENLLRKYKISQDVINCVAEHHEDKPFSSVESALVNLADHISGARPGARGEDYEAYIQRMQALEDAAMSFDGVEKAYAVSAGREVRVFVSPEHVDDQSTALLAREIARKIELEQTYPGVVKVIVIRETRASETAK